MHTWIQWEEETGWRGWDEHLDEMKINESRSDHWSITFVKWIEGINSLLSYVYRMGMGRRSLWVGFGPGSSGSKYDIQTQPWTKYLNFLKPNLFGLQNYETRFF